jgi:hypothetical protein
MSTPPLTVCIKKKTDGSAALSCRRGDGSVTWQRQDGKLGLFFPLHDLTHFAVETTLGLRESFFGLIAQGWDVSDFGAPFPRGRTPAEALHTERIIGTLDLERNMGMQWTPTERDVEQQALLDDVAANGGPRVTLEDLAAVRVVRARLFDRWYTLESGQTLELPLRYER